ncbi:MAG TPA: amino acid synthesis family protein [Geminicoccaceae bacterium]
MTELVQLRKITMQFEEIYHEGGPAPTKALVRGAILAVARNPYAGRYVEDVMPFMEALSPLGSELARRLIDALGGDPAVIEGFGKGAIVGTAGEIEHGALWHQPGGHALRDALGGAKAIVPSTKKVGAAGVRLDVPITHINASYVRSHFDAIEVGVPDAPRPDEIVFILVMSTGGRIQARCGGLRADEIKGEDGLR